MSNTWTTYPTVGDSLWKHGVIPDETDRAQVWLRKGAKAPL